MRPIWGERGLVSAERDHVQFVVADAPPCFPGASAKRPPQTTSVSDFLRRRRTGASRTQGDLASVSGISKIISVENNSPQSSVVCADVTQPVFSNIFDPDDCIQSTRPSVKWPMGETPSRINNFRFDKPVPPIQLPPQGGKSCFKSLPSKFDR